MLFSERIQTRRVRWGLGSSQWLSRIYKAPFHRLKEHYTFRNKTEPETKWHCCKFWQRALNSKWNAREFALKHGCPVPNLYWFGRNISRIPFESLPKHYVIKPNFGGKTRGVFVMADEMELLSGSMYSKARLQQELRHFTEPLGGQRFLVEELITDGGEYKLPTEYKCHVFNGNIAAIEVTHRSVNRQDTRRRYYTPCWKDLDQVVSTKYPVGQPCDRPACLNEILIMARVLGRAYGTYVRIDFYATSQRCIFNEFEPNPPPKHFTEFGDKYFGLFWENCCPQQI